jgi:hypothetical protein
MPRRADYDPLRLGRCAGTSGKSQREETWLVVRALTRMEVERDRRRLDSKGEKVDAVRCDEIKVNRMSTERVKARFDDV